MLVQKRKRVVIPSSAHLCEMELQLELSGGNRHSKKMLEPWLDTILSNVEAGVVSGRTRAY